MSLSVETPIPVLYRSLCRAGWGELAGREWQGVRSTLGAIVNRARSKQGIDCTVWQIAQSAGLSEKWTARCLFILEGLGVIAWQRGVIEEGKPKPGFITVCRHVLLDLVRQAWKQGYSKWTERRAETARRLALLKKTTANIRRSRRMELSGDHYSEILSTPSRVEKEFHCTTPPGPVKPVENSVKQKRCGFVLSTTPGFKPYSKLQAGGYVEEQASCEAAEQMMSIPRVQDWLVTHPFPTEPSRVWEWCQAYARIQETTTAEV